MRLIKNYYLSRIKEVKDVYKRQLLGLPGVVVLYVLGCIV